MARLDDPYELLGLKKDGGDKSDSEDHGGRQPSSLDDPYALLGLGDAPKPTPTRSLGDYARDVGTVALKGAIGVPQFAVGLADLVSGGAAGKAVENLGVRFKDANDMLDKPSDEIAPYIGYSKATQAAKEKVAAAGNDKNASFLSNIADKANVAIQNPSTILTAAGESLPSMFAGGIAGNAVKALAPKAVGWAAGKLGTSTEGMAGAIGEAAVTAGQNAEQVRSEDPNGELTMGQSGILSASGAATGALSILAQRVSRRLGIGNVDELVAKATKMGGSDATAEASRIAAGGVTRDAVAEAAQQKVKSFGRKMVEGAVVEGLMEELPQSIQEQVAQNLAQGKDLMDGVTDQAVMGLLTGGLMGSVAGPMHGHTHAVVDPNGANSSAPRGPSMSSQMASAAFTSPDGDPNHKATIALALNQMPDDERAQVITHLSQGDSQLAATLAQASTNEELLTQGRQLLQSPEAMMDSSAEGKGWIQFNEQLRQDSGLDQGVNDPSVTEASTAVNAALNPEAQNNEAGFQNEPMSDLNAQLQAVNNGTKPAMFLTEAQAQQMSLDPSRTAVMQDATGATGVVYATNPETLRTAVDRAHEVGLKQAAGEALGYVNPAATSTANPNSVVVQHVDPQGRAINEQVATTPEEVTAAHNAAPEGTSTRIVSPAQGLAERAALLAQEQQQQEQQSGTAASTPDVVQKPSFRSKKPTAVRTAVHPLTNVTRSKDQSHVGRLVAGMNENLEGDQRVDQKSIEQVDLPKAHRLSLMARAVKKAFGTNVVFVRLNNGNVVTRMDGKYHSAFNGLAMRGNGGTVFININADSPILNLFGHELAHILQTEAPAIYSALEIAVMARMSHQRALKHRDSLMSALDKEGDKGGYSERVQEVRDELVAEGVGEMAEDETFWAELFSQIGEDGSVARAVYNKLINVLTKLAQAITGGGYIDGLRNLKAVRTAVTSAYLQWARVHEAHTGSLDNYNKESQAQIKEDQKTIDKTEKELAKDEPPTAVEAEKPPTKEEEAPEVLPNGLTRMSRAAIRAVSKGLMIEPIQVLEKPTISLERSGLSAQVPITMEQSVVEKLLTGKDGLRRKMSEDDILELTGLIQNPVAILDDPTEKGSVVVVTSKMNDGEPIIVAIKKDTEKKQYQVDRFDELGRYIGKGNMAKATARTLLKTSFSKDMAGIMHWLNKVVDGRKIKVTHFDINMAKLWEGNYAGAIAAFQSRAQENPRAYRPKENVGGPLKQTASDSAQTASPSKQQPEQPATPTSVSVAQPQGISQKGPRTLSLRKSRQAQIDKVMQGLPTNYRGATLIDLLYGGEEHPVFTNAQGKINTRIGKWLEERSLKAFGGRMLNTANEKHQDMIASMVAAEALAAMDKDGNASQWYDQTIKNTVALAALIHPEIAKDTKTRNAFALATAITSQNLNVEDNMKVSMKIMDAWKKDGSNLFPTNMGTGKSAGQINSNFIKANEFISQLGWDGFIDLLNSRHSNSFLTKVFGSGSSGDNMNLMMSGSAVFGPKIGGGFFQNLMGNFNPVTMDMWFSRTIGRLTGKVRAFDSELIGNQIDAMREAFAQGGDDTRSIQAKQFADTIDKDLFMSDDDYAIGAAEEIRLAHEKDFKKNRSKFDSKKRFKSALVSRAEAVINTAESLRDSPENGTHRNELRNITFKAVEKIKKASGQDVAPATLQALVWYPEQFLYKKFGGRQRVVGQDYVGAISKVLEERGFNNDQIRDAIKSASTDELGASLVGPEATGPDATQGTGKAAEPDQAVQRRIETSEESAKQDVTFEVAPNPDNKELNDAWQALPEKRKIEISLKLGKRFAKKVLSRLGMSGDVELRTGSYMDATTPSFALKLNKGGDPMLAAGMLGHVLSQREMMVTAERPFKGGEKRGAITINLPEGMGMDAINDFYQNLRQIKNAAGESVVGGQTTANNQMAILNFSEYSAQQLSNAEMAALIDDHLGGKYTVDYTDVFSAMPGESDYSYDSEKQNGSTIARQPSLKGDADSLRAEATAAIAKELGIGKSTRASETNEAKAAGLRLSRSDLTPLSDTDQQLLDTATSLADEWRSKLNPDIELVLGGSLVSGLYVQTGNEAVDMDVRFLADDLEQHIQHIEDVTGLKLKKEIQVADFPIGTSKAYMIEGFIDHNGMRFEVEGALRGRSYVGWQNGYRAVFSQEELEGFKKQKAELKGDKKAYKAFKNGVIRAAQDRLISQNHVPLREYNIPESWSLSDDGKVYIDERGYERGLGLNSNERFAEQLFYDDIHNDTQGLMDAYFNKNGLLVDADLVKDLSKIYESNNGYANAVHEPSSYLAKKLWPEALSLGVNKTAVITAGGPASGKSATGRVAEKMLGITANSATFDSSLTSLKTAVSLVKAAKAAGNKVYINYTNTPAINAFRGSLDRPRMMKLDLIARNHLRASEAIRQVYQHFKDDPSVVITVLNFDHSNRSTTIGGIEDIPRYNYNDLERKMYAVAKERLADNSIDQHTFNYVTKNVAGNVGGEISGNVGAGQEYVRDRSGNGADAEAVLQGQQSSDHLNLRLSRSIQPTTVSGMLDQLRKGKIDYNLTEAFRRDQYAAAFQQAKNPDERKSALRKMTDVLIHTFADSMVPVKRWIESADISPLLKQALVGDLYRAETVRSYLEKDFTDKYIDPMYKEIARVAKVHKLSTDEVKKFAGWWMSARYAPKANAMLIAKDRAALTAAQATGDPAKVAEAQANLRDRIADVNGSVGAQKVRGVAGGMNNAEAAAAVQEAEKLIDKQLLNGIAKHVYDMLEAKKQMDIANGKVTQTMVNGWANHKDYVPLTGDPRRNGMEESDYFGGAGNQVNQASDKAMNGRKDSVADDGIDASIEATLKSINHAGFQDFKRSLNKAYEEAQAAGKNIGLNRESINGRQRLSDDAVMFRDTAKGARGIEKTQGYSFTFDNQNVVPALKKANMEHLNSAMALLGKATSFYGRVVTQFMPMFAPINFVRDIWERSELMRVRKLIAANGKEFDSKDMDRLARKSIANSMSPEVWAATAAKAWGRNGPGSMTKARGYLEELIRTGGLSTWNGHINRSGTEIEDAIRNKDMGKAGKFMQGFSHKVESYNLSFEMVPSLAIHMALREAGVSAKDSSAFVLDLMNFKKRGTAMPAIRSLYAFAQPSATSGYNLAQYLSTKKGLARFAAQGIIATAVYALLKAQWGGEDDDELGDKIDNLSNYTTDRSLPVKLGGYILKLPIGFGPPQLAWAMGVNANRWGSGRYTAKDAIFETGKGFAKSMAPVNPSDIEMSKRPGDFIAQTLTPTFLKPLFNIYADQTSMGGGLTPQFKDPNKFNFQQAKNTTPQIYSDIAKEIHDITGVDLYPDHVKALSDGYFVGPLHELSSMYADAEAKKSRGEPEQIPVAHAVIDTINDRARLSNTYYRYRDQLMDANKQFEYLKKEDPGEITPELRQQAMAFKRFENSEKIFAMQRAALKKQNLDPEIHDAKLQGIEDRAEAAKKRVLVQYIDAVK